MNTMRKKYDEETAKKVCGSLQAKYEKDFDHKLIVEKYNKLKLEHPEFDERRLLEEVFNRMTKDFQEDLKERKINSAFLTLEEYKLLKEGIPEGLKDLHRAIFFGRQRFKLRANIEIIQESPYIFFDIKNEKEPIFILDEPLNISLNELEIIDRESIYESGGTKYYYEYEGEKYFQKERFDHNYRIWSRSYAPIYPYVTLKELKPRLKLRGLKRIYNKHRLLDYVRKPFEHTREEKKQLGKGKGWYGEPERHSKARKTGRADFSHLTKLTKDVYVDGHAHIIYPLKDLTDKQIQSIFNALSELRKAGIYFDTGYNVKKNEREWLMDWSLKGAKVRVESLDNFREDLKQKYYCQKCKSHHFYDSEKGIEHLSQNQKTIKAYKVKLEEKKEIQAKIKEKDEMTLSEEEYALAHLGYGKPYPSYEEYLKKVERKKKLKEIEKRMTPEQLQKLKIHYGMGLGESEKEVLKETQIEELTKRAKEIIEKYRYVLYKSSIGILKHAIEHKDLEDLEEYVPKFEKKAIRMAKEQKKERERKEALEKQHKEIVYGDVPTDKLEKELKKLEREQEQLWQREKKLRPDERTQRKATIKNRQLTISRERTRIEEVLKERKIKTEEIKTTKTDLNRVIKWSSSRFNEYKKSDIIEIILDKIKEGKDYKERFGTGSFAESGHLAGYSYIFEVKDGKSTLFDEFNKVLYKIKEKKQKDFSFPETMQRSIGTGRIVKNKGGICDDCKKEVDSYFYKKLCEECYLKRVKNYIKVYDLKEDVYIKKPIFIFDSIGETLEYVANMFDFINLTEDEAIRRVESHIPSGQTRLQKLWETQKLYEEARRRSTQLGIDPSVSPVASITIPFSITNTQTGKTMKGEVVENIEKNTRQLQPVSSSNVRASGQFGTELLVQFHPAKLQPLRTYRYMFETPEQAREANESLIKSGSPGRWVWQNLRGHVAGTPVVSSKLGPSLSPPGQGLPTIGGTTASLVEYKISNRVPVSRVKNFDEVLKEMKRTTPNPIIDPMTGSRIEALMGTRKELREMKEPGWRKGLHRLPPIGDFVYVGNLNELEEDYKVKGHWRHLKSGKKTWVKEHERGEKKLLLWKRLKNKRKEYEKIKKKLEELYQEIPFDDPEHIKEKKRKKIDKLQIQSVNLYSELSKQVPKRKKWEKHLEYLEDSLKWAKNAKKYDKKEIERELKLEEKKEYKPNYKDFEWKLLLEQYEQWDERIKGYKEGVEEAKKELKKVDIFELELFEDKNDILHDFDITLHKKLKIQKGLIIKYLYLAEDKINTINNAFYDLPKHLQDSCRQIRIFEKATDDPSFGSLKSCGGFYDSVDETITIGLKTNRKDVFGYSDGFLKRTTVHESAHALDFNTLTYNERDDVMSFFSANYQRLKNRGEYASTNKLEFFAEGYTKLFFGDHHWFRGLTKGTKGFFQNIMKKYDFIVDSIMIDLKEKINGIKFSYQDGDNHIFGVYRIPEDIFPEEADKLVKERKAQYENIDKYFEIIKEKEVDRNEQTTN